MSVYMCSCIRGVTTNLEDELFRFWDSNAAVLVAAVAITTFAIAVSNIAAYVVPEQQLQFLLAYEKIWF